MNKKDREYLSRLADLGCIVPLEDGDCGGLAEIHHIRDGQGLGQRASHHQTLALCAAHHRTGGYGVAFHAGRKEFERKYGTEAELLAKVRRLLGIDDETSDTTD